MLWQCEAFILVLGNRLVHLLGYPEACLIQQMGSNETLFAACKKVVEHASTYSMLQAKVCLL